MTLVTHVRYIDDVKLKVLLCVSQLIAEVTLNPLPHSMLHSI